MIYQISLDLMHLVFGILMLLFFILVFTIGIFLLIRGYQRKLNNIIIMGGAFLAMTIGFLMQFLIKEHGFLIREILSLIGFTFIIIFTNMTFYKHKSHLSNYLLIIGILLAINQFIFQLFVDYITPNNKFIHYTKIALDLPFNLLVFNWMAFAAYSSYKKLRDEQIAPWIKTRYKLIALSSFIMSFHSIPEFFQPFEIPMGDPSNLTSLIVLGFISAISIIFVILFGLAWIMPNWLKNLFNKEYSPVEEEYYSENELMELIKNQLYKREIYGNI